MDEIIKFMTISDAIRLACEKTGHSLNDIVHAEFITDNNIKYQRWIDRKSEITTDWDSQRPHWQITFMTHDEFNPDEKELFNGYGMKCLRKINGHVRVYDINQVEIQG